MHARPRTKLWIAGLALSVVSFAADVGVAPGARAQIREGEFGLIQSSALVGWAFASADRTKEYWAYIDSEYSFADVSNTDLNPWNLQLKCIGSTPWSSYDAWKADVLKRTEALGKSVTFQNHSVVEEHVSN